MFEQEGIDDSTQTACLQVITFQKFISHFQVYTEVITNLLLLFSYF